MSFSLPKGQPELDIDEEMFGVMIGRAGRAGFCRTGESILLLQDKDWEKVLDLLSEPYDRCEARRMEWPYDHSRISIYKNR